MSPRLQPIAARPLSDEQRAALPSAERVKAQSGQLRGTLAQETAADTVTYGDAAVALLKFHGVYQQEDRDARRQARQSGGSRRPVMMIRTRVPGGVVSADAYLAHDRIASRFGDGRLRITTRQDFQTHFVLKADLRDVIREINDTLLTTLGGCGDQERNIMCCPLPREDALHGELREVLHGLVRGLTPTTTAYAEVWLDGERVADNEPELDELYGETYLPRKFKTALAVEGDNCVDVYSNDLGLVAHRAAGGGLAGFTLLVGGGLGRTHRKPETYPAVARPLAFVTPDQALDAARAVVSVQRDHGDRSNRRHARLKYLIAERGIEWFGARVQERLGFTLAPARPLRWDPVDDHLGWHPQGDGRLSLGLHVENGRIQDTAEQQLRTVLRRLVGELRPRVVLTPQQNLLLTNLGDQDRGRIEEILAVNAVRPLRALPLTVRNSMACPALPTCGLAVAEAERVAPALTRAIAAVVDELGLDTVPISWRMTGCPNACTRPYLGDVGIVGTTLGKYDVQLGGDTEGTRLNVIYASNVPLALLPDVLRAPLSDFAAGRGTHEGFGDFCHRVGVDELRRRHLGGDADRAATELSDRTPQLAGV